MIITLNLTLFYIYMGQYIGIRNFVYLPNSGIGSKNMYQSDFQPYPCQWMVSDQLSCE